MSLKYSTDDCFIIFLSRKKSVTVLYQHALGGRKPILKLKWILFPFLKRTWRSLRSEFVHSVTQQLIERLLQGGYRLEAGDTKMNWMQALPLGNPEPSRDWQVNRSLQSSAGWRGQKCEADDCGFWQKGTKVSLIRGERISGQASLRRWYPKWVLSNDQMLLLSSKMNSDYLPMKHPLINTEANVFLWTIFFFSTILDCFSAAGWNMPRQFQFFQQITFQMFHQPQQNKGLPHRWASFFFPFPPPPRLYNTNWCHQGTYFPSGRYQLVLMSRQVAGFTRRLQRELKWQDSSHTQAPRTGRGIQQMPWGAVVALGVAPPKAGKLHAPP